MSLNEHCGKIGFRFLLELWCGWVLPGVERGYVVKLLKGKIRWNKKLLNFVAKKIKN